MAQQLCKTDLAEKSEVRSIIAKMTPEQKVGTTLTFGMCGTVITPDVIEAIERFHCSGLRMTPYARSAGNYVDPVSGEVVVKVNHGKGYKPDVNPPYCTLTQFSKLLGRLQSMALSRPQGIPLHFSFDQEGGSSADLRMGGITPFPKPMGIAATGDPAYAYKQLFQRPNRQRPSA